MQLLLIEDDPTISKELQFHWARHQWVVRTCGTLAQGDAALRDASPDLIVLDLALPDGDGLLWLEQLRGADHKTPVLVLTARDQVADRVAGLRRGADDYLVKPFATDELDARVEALMRRSRQTRSLDTQCGPLMWLPSAGKALLHGEVLLLLPREFEVLGLLIQNSPHLVYKRDLLDALAGDDVGDNAIEVYISRLRRKLENSGVSIHTVRGFGYRLTVDTDVSDVADSA